MIALLSTFVVAACKKECDCKEADAKGSTHDKTATVEGKDVDTPSDGVHTSTPKGGNSGKSKSSGRPGSDNLSNPAPDGTDAENHDGDSYTRNDTSRKPTGTTIK